MIKDDKYWNDYTQFLAEVEKITERDPASLIQRYLELIEELEDLNEDFYLEWKYEFNNSVFIRELIQNVIDHSVIVNNLLLKPFKEKILGLDIRIEKHIYNFQEDNWWRKPIVKFQNIK